MEDFEKANIWNKINNMSIQELLNSDFVIENTDYNSLEEMIAAAGTNDFDSLEWDDFVYNFTIFLSWEEMLRKARRDMFNRLV